ncbi:uncharacterized protein LOC130285305 [Hyla sarda]|uniref:uncharacterized protein LOC130285305 n=1 Tax=Hyla sarda TaxID=327740 RepID=UPI0024C21472|nr:uncharacterized protein LOC130285305 [Hyla sarda]
MASLEMAFYKYLQLRHAVQAQFCSLKFTPVFSDVELLLDTTDLSKPLNQAYALLQSLGPSPFSKAFYKWLADIPDLSEDQWKEVEGSYYSIVVRLTPHASNDAHGEEARHHRCNKTPCPSFSQEQNIKVQPQKITPPCSVSEKEIIFEEQSVATETVTTSSEWNSNYPSETSVDDELQVRPTPTPRRRIVVENTVLQNLLHRLQSPVDEENRLHPYCFQNDPQWGPNEERPAPIPDLDGRCGNNNWCQCTCCHSMTSVLESICCWEYSQINTSRENYKCGIP